MTQKALGKYLIELRAMITKNTITDVQLRTELHYCM